MENGEYPHLSMTISGLVVQRSGMNSVARSKQLSTGFGQHIISLYEAVPTSCNCVSGSEYDCSFRDVFPCDAESTKWYQSPRSSWNRWPKPQGFHDDTLQYRELQHSREVQDGGQCLNLHLEDMFLILRVAREIREQVDQGCCHGVAVACQLVVRRGREMLLACQR